MPLDVLDTLKEVNFELTNEEFSEILSSVIKAEEGNTISLGVIIRDLNSNRVVLTEEGSLVSLKEDIGHNPLPPVLVFKPVKEILESTYTEDSLADIMPKTYPIPLGIICVDDKPIIIVQIIVDDNKIEGFKLTKSNKSADLVQICDLKDYTKLTKLDRIILPSLIEVTKNNI